MSRANLRGANYLLANLQNADLTKAIYNDKTQWDENFSPTAAGAVKEKRQFNFVERLVETFVREKGSTRFNEKK
jgi:hypothetical protein